MVAVKTKKLFFRIGAIIGAFLLATCSLPQYYNDFDSRFAFHDVFNFITPSDRSPALGNDYSFIVASDIHISSDESAREFAKLKDHIGDSKFIVVTGDITQNGTKEELQRFIDVAATFGAPCYPAIGNHDVYVDNAGPWKELIGSATYRIDASDAAATLFILDNANASFGREQLEWLEQEMKHTQKRVFVFAHDNFFISSSPPDFEQTTDIVERARLMSLLQGRCDMMFMGHLHKRIVKEYGGVTYIMLENYSEQKRTICRVHVSEDGVYYEFEKL
jgi:predicted phosphodiesterase